MRTLLSICAKGKKNILIQNILYQDILYNNSNLSGLIPNHHPVSR